MSERPGAYELRSADVALHFARKQKLPPAFVEGVLEALAEVRAGLSVPYEFTDEPPIPRGCVRLRLACHWCRVPYVRDTEPEYADAVLRFGICDRCYEAEENIR
jgi:hypothetical protein